MSVYQLKGVALQADGKIMGAGCVTTGLVSNFLAARYSGTSGILDASFGGSGVVTTSMGDASAAGANAVAIQADGKIVVVGYAMSGGFNNFAIARYSGTDGSLDNTFGASGKVLTLVGGGGTANAVAIQADGKIVVVGTAVISGTPYIVTIRYSGTDGSLDTTFNGTGIRTDALDSSATHGYAVAIQPDTGIVVGGICAGNFVVARYSSAGALDTTFNSVGWRTTSVGNGSDSVHALLIQSDTKIVAVGSSSSNFALVRYTSAGALDGTFGTGGVAITDCSESLGALSAILQSDQKIVLAGFCSASTVVARYDTAGAVDGTYGIEGKRSIMQGADSQALSLALQADGSVVGVGSSDNNVLVFRVLATGNIDTSFGSNGIVVTPVGVGDVAPNGQSSTVSKTSSAIVSTSTSTYATLMTLDNVQPGNYIVTFDSTVTNTTGVITDAVKFRISIGGVEQDSSERQIGNLGDLALYTNAFITVSTPSAVNVEWAIVGAGYTYTTKSSRALRARKTF